MANNIKIQRNIAFLAIALFIVKIIAWWLTKSLTIYTDALESIVNVVAGLIGWYSLWVAAKPRDLNHPYGHGKAEFISAAVEGTMISLAGILIIIEAIQHIAHPQSIGKLDTGILLVTATAIINFIAGRIAIQRGNATRSVALVASGRHLQSDTYTTIGVVLGLILIRFTGWVWLDPYIAILFACIILVTGYKVLRRSLAGIMDEADMGLLEDIISFINQYRPPQWIDLHNLRMIQYGNVLHLDGHLTLPWYYNVREAHAEIDRLDQLIREKYGNSVELFVHVDGCVDFSCRICSLQDCPVRNHPLVKHLRWTPKNVLENKKHFVP